MKVNTELMGKIVLVNKELVRTRERDTNSYHTSVHWKAVAANGRSGWVVGERWLQNGEIMPSSYDDQGYLRETDKRTHCVLVTYWPTMKPVYVPDDGYVLASETVKPYFSACLFTKDAREYLREEMSAWPRDAKGRWVKKGEDDA